MAYRDDLRLYEALTRNAQQGFRAEQEEDLQNQLLGQQNSVARDERVAALDQRARDNKDAFVSERAATPSPYADQTAERNKRKQQVADTTWQMGLKFFSNPANGGSPEEFAQFQQQYINATHAESLPNPLSLITAEDNEASPERRVARAAESLAQMFPDLGYNADQLVNFIPNDPKTGQPDPAKLLDFMTKQQELQRPDRMSIRDNLKSINDQIESFKSDPLLFDQDTGLPREELSYGMFLGSSQAEVDAQRLRRIEYEQAIAEKQRILGMQQGLIPGRDNAAPTAPAANTSPSSPTAQINANSGQFVARNAAEVPTITQRAIEAARAQNKTKALVYVPGPDGNPKVQIIDVP